MGDEHLISKKELLDLTGISYGQLYRWKRKGLIPEAWFLKKSAFTGQETFFPRVEMLARVERIKGMKDDLALDDLADLLAPAPRHLELHLEDLVSRNILSKTTVDLLFEVRPLTDPLDFETVLHGWIAERLLGSGSIGLEEASLILKTLAAHPFEGGDPSGQFLFARKRGVGFCLIVFGSGTPHLDPDARVVAQHDFLTLVGDLRIALSGDKK